MVGTAAIGDTQFCGGTQSISGGVFYITRYRNFGLPLPLFGLSGTTLLASTGFANDVASTLHVRNSGVVAMSHGFVLTRCRRMLFVGG